MRVTNNIITNNTKNNINANKINVDKYNTQMTTQAKISRASEDPVIAIRSLRLGTNLSHIEQWVENNIPDAEAWLSVTETALTNMESLLRDIRTQCVNGSTDSLGADDRETILKALTALQDQVYAEGNADYAGRTIFTGYRTTSNLTFNTDEADTTYQITQKFTYQDMTEQRYYNGSVEIPSDTSADCTTEISVNAYQRIRLAYDGTQDLDSLSYTTGGVTTTLIDGGTVQAGAAVTTYETMEDWEDALGEKTVGDNEIVYIKGTGELIFGKQVALDLRSGKAELEVTYTKQGFDEGELRPEYYYDCSDVTDPDNPVTYTKEDQPINYSIASKTTLTVNTQASDVFDSSIARDVNELIDIVQKAIDAHDKVDKIKVMMGEAQYSSDEDQAVLQTYLDAAEKEAAYADDNMQKTYEQYITNFNNYLERVNIAITNIGSQMNRLSMTQTRVENQQSTVEELKSNNDNRDISDIMIDFYAAYNAYTASLMAASQVEQTTLLNYL